MAILSKIIKQQDQSTNLTKQEIELLLDLIKKSTFTGESVEVLYQLVLKLQTQYLNQEQ